MRKDLFFHSQRASAGVVQFKNLLGALETCTFMYSNGDKGRFLHPLHLSLNRLINIIDQRRCSIVPKRRKIVMVFSGAVRFPRGKLARVIYVAEQLSEHPAYIPSHSICLGVRGNKKNRFQGGGVSLSRVSRPCFRRDNSLWNFLNSIKAYWNLSSFL